MKMARQTIQFRVKNRELFKKALQGAHDGILSTFVHDNAKSLEKIFKKHGFLVNSKKNTLSKALNSQSTFSQITFNSFLCCLLDGMVFTDQSLPNRHGIKDFNDFYEAVKTPESLLSEQDVRKYNLIIQEVAKSCIHLKTFNLEMKDNWRVVSPQIERVIFPKKRKWYLALAVVLISIFVVTLNLSSSNESENFQGESGDDVIDLQHCLFTPDSTKHQILILPFKLIDKKLGRGDIGFFIKQRLDKLNRADSLGLELKFCEEFVPTGDEKEYYEKIKTKFNANHIIYGFSNGCSDSDLICLNYITDFSEFGTMKANFTDNAFENFKNIGLTEIGDGALQENIDYLIYYNALIASYNQRKYDKAISYSTRLLRNESSNKGELHFVRGLSYYFLYKDDLALIDLHKSLENPYPFNHHVAQGLIGTLYAYYNQNVRAKLYLEKAMPLDPNDELITYLYEVNRRLGRHQDNIELMTNAFKLNTKLKYSFLHWRAESKKELGMIQESKNDSVNASEYFKNNPGELEMHSILAQARIEVGAGHRANVLASKFNVYDHREKHSDSLEKDLCRLFTIAPDEFNISLKNGNNNVECKSFWPEVFAVDKVFDSK